MAKVKYFTPERELPKNDLVRGWIIKYEYQIRAYLESNLNGKKSNLVLEVLSFREFAFFKYTIDYEMTIKNRDILIILKGISTDHKIFPDSGKAYAKIKFDDLAGEYNLYIKRQSGEENFFQIYVDPYQNKIEWKEELPDKKTNRKFVELIK